MKNTQQRTESINNKVAGKLRARKAWITAVSLVCVFAIAITVCSVPIIGGSDVPNINAYKSDAYYPLISKINGYYYKPTPKTSIFAMAFNAIGKFFFSFGATAPAPMPDMDGNMATSPDAAEHPTTPGSTEVSNPSSNYEETTLNQVNGVIEGDLLKRSNKNVFYLKKSTAVSNPTWIYQDYYAPIKASYYSLDIYDINKGDTALITTYEILAKDETSFGGSVMEMYLSNDASTVTIISDCRYNKQGFTCVITLNVSNLENITEVGRTYISGGYLSSRKVGGKLLVVTNFNCGRVNYDDKSSFVPSCGDTTQDYIAMDDIYLPQDVSSCTYTILAEMDEQTQQVTSKCALFSYAQDINVSKDYIFVLRTKTCAIDSTQYYDGEKSGVTVHSVTDIVALKYANGFEQVANFCVEGYVKDRYSLDEKDGILRIVTTPRKTIYSFADDVIITPDLAEANVNSPSLYCIDIATQQVAGKKENFAPVGEEVKSVRFNGDVAYVCTAIRNTDPVFAFDLSNLNDIKVKDTGTIPGFSISLLTFGDKLLGIGQGENWGSLKIEAYEQTDSAVKSAGAFEMQYCEYSSEYKAHFVDAEHQLVGLQLRNYNIASTSPSGAYSYPYLLLRYNDEAKSFETVAMFDFSQDVNDVRAFYCDNGVYVFCSDKGVSFVDLSIVE